METKNPQKNIRNPKKPKLKTSFKIAAGATAITLVAAGIGTTVAKNKETDIVPVSSYQSFCENENVHEYTVSEETLQKFIEFEKQLKIYENLSENPEGLTYVQSQELDKAKQYIKSNYKTLEEVYLYQAKAKVVKAYHLPAEKLSDTTIKQTGIYTSITDESSTTSIPKISNAPKAYLGKLTGNNSNVVIPSELKNAISDIVTLQRIWSEDDNFPYKKILNKYNNFLKFLSLEFESDEKGNISLSDKEYEPSDEDIVEFYSPIYENLKQKKDLNGGKLKKSQEMRFQEVMSKMHSSLLNVVSNKINKLEDYNYNGINEYRERLENLLAPVTEGYDIVSPYDVIPYFLDMNYELDNLLKDLSAEQSKISEHIEEER